MRPRSRWHRLHKWAHRNGRTRGLKANVNYRSGRRRTRAHCKITRATANGVVVDRRQPIELGATYVFDRACADYAWWRSLHEAGCGSVSRPKSNVPLPVIAVGEVGPAADFLAPDLAPRGRPPADHIVQRSQAPGRNRRSAASAGRSRGCFGGSSSISRSAVSSAVPKSRFACRSSLR